MPQMNPIQVQKFLKGVDYPATKATLLAQAEEQGADADVRAWLEQLPDQEFKAPVDVSQALGDQQH